MFFFLEVTLICLTLADCSGMKSSLFCPHAGEQRQKNSSGSFSKGRWCLTGQSQGLAARQLHVGLLDLPRWTRGGLVQQQKSASPLGFLETQKAAAASAPGGPHRSTSCLEAAGITQCLEGASHSYCKWAQKTTQGKENTPRRDSSQQLGGLL